VFSQSLQQQFVINKCSFIDKQGTTLKVFGRKNNDRDYDVPQLGIEVCRKDRHSQF
jgi:hypothetical protein